MGQWADILTSSVRRCLILGGPRASLELSVDKDSTVDSHPTPSDGV